MPRIICTLIIGKRVPDFVEAAASLSQEITRQLATLDAKDVRRVETHSKQEGGNIMWQFIAFVWLNQEEEEDE